MGNAQYIDFLNAAWNLAGDLAHENVELVKPDDSHIEIDPESEFRLCVQNPEKLESLKSALAEFEYRANEMCGAREKEKTA